MNDDPSIQHWLVSVARRVGLRGADDLEASPDAPPGEAWSSVASATGVDAAGLAEHVARHFRLDRADLDAADPTATRLLPAATARRLGVLPLAYTDRILTVATADPTGMETEREVGRLSARSVVMEVAPPGALREAVERAYPEEEGPGHQLPAIPAAGGEGPHVLVVEDDPGTRALLRSTLEGHGFRVSEAPDGVDALEILALRPVHLVTLDLQMLEVDGLEVLRLMRSRAGTARIPVVVVTGTDDPEVEMRALATGADDFVVKPVDPPRFLLRVQAVLRRYGVTLPPPGAS